MNSDYNKKLYDKYVTTHLSNKIEERIVVRKSYLCKLIKKHFPDDLSAKILELGCGHGALFYYASQNGYTNLLGVDISEEQLNEARKLGLDAEFIQDDILNVLHETADSSCDLIVALDVIEHMSKSDLLDMLDNVFRVLCDGGKLVLHAPNAVSPFFGRVRYGDYTHVQAFTQSSLTQLLTISGFSKIMFYEDVPSVHGLGSAARWIAWKGIRGVFRLIMAVESGVTNEIFSQNFLAVVKKGK